MITYPPAKINIGLNVVNKRPDGLHSIESIFYAIPLVDILEINKADFFEFTMSGLGIEGSTSDNLVVRAFNLIKENHSISDVKIHLHKQIPMGAGLGGGSADATYTLTMLNVIFDLGLSTEKLEQYATSLGSDCPFFIESTPKYVAGIGNEMRINEVRLAGYYLWLINPDIHISTKEAYEDVTPLVSDHDLNTEVKKDLSEWKLVIKNDFETSIFAAHPILSEIKGKMYANGALYASMSGSGSTLYAICENKPNEIGTFSFEKLILL